MSTKEISGQTNKATAVTTSRMRNVLLRGTLVLSSVLVALMMAEGIVRIFLPQTVSVPWWDEMDGVMAPRPNLRGRIAVPGTFDTTMSYNSQRFRGLREYSQTPATGVTRIATLGDSYTYGWGANDNETYPVQLERYLVKRLSGSTSDGKVEVINAANAGSGTGEQAMYYFIWVSRFQPDFVCASIPVPKFHARWTGSKAVCCARFAPCGCRSSASIVARMLSVV